MKYSTQYKLRVAGINFLNNSGFRHLSTVPWLDYREAIPTQCARLLHEGEVEFALIPIVEFAQMGGYRPLPFGIAANGIVDSVLVLGERSLEELDAIVLDTLSQTSVLLLKCLLREYYPETYGKIRFTRSSEPWSQIGGTTGALIIGDRALELRRNYSHCIDLAGLWKEKTGLPFIFAIWAGRPENLDDETVEALNQAIPQSVRYRELYARDWADQSRSNRENAVTYVTDFIKYQLDAEAYEGANHFLELAHNFGWLPELRLQEPNTDDNDTEFLRCKPRSQYQIMRQASEAKRLSIRDARTLLEDLPPTHMLLAAELARVKHLANPDRHPRRNFEIPISNISITATRFDSDFVPPGDSEGYVKPWDSIARRLESLPKEGERQVTLTCGLHPELDLDYFCGLIRHLKREFQVRIAGLSAEHVWYLSKTGSISVHDVLKKLKASELDLLGDHTEFLLVDRVRRRVGPIEFRSEDALSIQRLAHDLGMQTVAGFPVSPADTWRDRQTHLEKVRKLHDETRGFAYIACHPILAVADRKVKPLQVLDYMLAVSLARLLVDNIPVIETTPVGFGTPVAEITLHCGADTSVGI